MRPGGDALGGVTPKRWTVGTHRARTPAETLEAVAPLLRDCGITRVAGVTGLDRIGIPVVMVVRPNGRTLSVFQGKGVTVDAARASGVMEALEAHHAEHHVLRVEVTDRAGLGPAASVDPLLLPLRAGATWTPASRVPWVEGVDVVRGGRAWVPLERVAVDYTLPRAPGLGLFVQDSNGLASGNCLAEAMLHALLELVERDARALAPRSGVRAVRPLVDPASAEDAVVDELVARCSAAGMALELRDLTTDVEVPVVEAVIAERKAGALPPIRPVRGYGCHLDARIAVTRAITEAAQARLTVIAGSRDDLTAAHYPDPAGGPRRHARRPAAGPARDHLALRRSRAGTTIEGDVRAVLEALASCGMESAVAVDLSPPDGPVAVVRMVVPGLEGYAGRRGYTPGPRARAAARTLAAT